MTLILSGTNGLSDVDGDASTPAVRGTDANSGIFFGADQVGVSTNGVERVEFGNSETVFNDGGADVDFRVEGDTDANLLFVDASADEELLGVRSRMSARKILLNLLQMPQKKYRHFVRLLVNTKQKKTVSAGQCLLLKMCKRCCQRRLLKTTMAT
jgi:hypothetical protein